MSCYKCKDRKPYCHSTCEDYKAESEKRMRANEKRKEETNFNRYLQDSLDNMKSRKGKMRV